MTTYKYKRILCLLLPTFGLGESAPFKRFHVPLLQGATERPSQLSSSSAEVNQDRHTIFGRPDASSILSFPFYPDRFLQSWLPVFVIYGITDRLVRRSEAFCRAMYFWKRAGPIVSHYKFTEWWMDVTHANSEKRDRVYKRLHDRYYAPSLDLILHLKGLYVKVGQVLSSRPDFMPPQYIKAFATLQDAVPQWSIESIEAIVIDSLKAEYGLKWEDVFETMDPVALGSASIGQVHRAVIKKRWLQEDENYTGGEVVAVKVMHPGAKKRFACDFQVFRWLCRIAFPELLVLLDELEKRLMSEFDYRNEADSLAEVRTNLQKSSLKRCFCIPQPLMALCCKEVLVMEMLEGKKLVDSFKDRLTTVLGGNDKLVDELLEKKKSELFMEEDGSSKGADDLINYLELSLWNQLKLLYTYRQIKYLVDLIVDVHGQQIFLDGCFNGDPHPGNIMELDKNGVLGLIDYGQTRRFDNKERLGLARIVAAVGNKASDKEIAESMRSLGFRTKKNSDEILAKYAVLLFDSDIAGAKLGFATPHHYFAELMWLDPLIDMPPEAIWVCRVSMMFRAVGKIIDQPVHTASVWSKHANKALRLANN